MQISGLGYFNELDLTTAAIAARGNGSIYKVRTTLPEKRFVQLSQSGETRRICVLLYHATCHQLRVRSPGPHE